jgi:hypothetical protein
VFSRVGGSEEYDIGASREPGWTHWTTEYFGSGYSIKELSTCEWISLGDGRPFDFVVGKGGIQIGNGWGKRRVCRWSRIPGFRVNAGSDYSRHCMLLYMSLVVVVDDGNTVVQKGHVVVLSFRGEISCGEIHQ